MLRNNIQLISYSNSIKRITHVEQIKIHKELKNRTKVSEQTTIKHIVKVCWKTMPLSIRYYTIFTILQVTPHQGDVRYSTSGGIQYLWISLMSINWTLFMTENINDRSET